MIVLQKSLSFLDFSRVVATEVAVLAVGDLYKAVAAATLVGQTKKWHSEAVWWSHNLPGNLGTVQ